ncbi:MAG TPA: hypothetical protein VFV52_14340 [Bacilli bacterium]|nr:hypothetical protein [Bacilli bacterium]
MKKKGLLLSLGLALSLLIPSLNAPQQVAEAATAPANTVSYYMDTINTTTLYNMGYSLGTHDYNTSGTQKTLVVLAFGGQTSSYGGSLWGAADASTSQIAAAAEEFSHGYWSGTRSDTGSTVKLVIGTNNSYTVNYTAGQRWSQMINDIGAYNNSHSYSSQVLLYGGNDMEMSYDTPSATRSWVNGYASVDNYLYYNYGDAGGCTTSSTFSGTYNGSCNNGWTMNDIYYISWGAAPGQSVPEIYNTSGANARQWKNVKKYARVTLGANMIISGAMTQYGACVQNGGCSGTNNTPSAGWSQLYNALNSDADTAQGLAFSTDIKWH